MPIDYTEVRAMEGKNRLCPGPPAHGFGLEGPAGLPETGVPVSVIHGGAWTCATPADTQAVHRSSMATVIPPRYLRKEGSAPMGHVTIGQIYRGGVPTGEAFSISEEMQKKVRVVSDPQLHAGAQQPMANTDLDALRAQVEQNNGQTMAMMQQLLHQIEAMHQSQGAQPTQYFSPTAQPQPRPQPDPSSTSATPFPPDIETFQNDPSIAPVHAVQPSEQQIPPAPPQEPAAVVPGPPGPSDPPQENVALDRRVVQISDTVGSPILLRLDDCFVFDTERAFILLGAYSLEAQLRNLSAEAKYRHFHIIQPAKTLSLANEEAMIDLSMSGSMLGGTLDDADMYITVLWKRAATQ